MCGVPNCGRSFQQREYLLQHTADAHPAPRPASASQSFRCGVPGCGQSFPQLERLRQHGRSHNTAPRSVVSVAVNQPYRCGVPSCGQSFQVQSDLVQHGVSAYYQINIDRYPNLSNTTDFSQKFPYDCISSLFFCLGVLSYISITSSPPPLFPSSSPSLPSPASPTGTSTLNSENVDARYSAFNNVAGSQYHINHVIGPSFAHLHGYCGKLTFFLSPTFQLRVQNLRPPSQKTTFATSPL
jgi:hypothetical protein